MASTLLSIVLPVYNQADHVRDVVAKYEAALGNVPIAREMILVPNGCTDDSEAICAQLAKEFPSVRVKVSDRRGWGHAVRLGLAESRGDPICYTNLSRTQPEDLTLLLLYAVANPGVVIKANRKIREGALRRFGSLLYNLECRLLFDLSYWDINGTPKVFPRKFQKLVTISREDDLIDLEFNVICRRENLPVLEVPIFSNRRFGGRSTTNLGSAFRMYWGAYQMWRENKAP
jgi:glycosyltransferase involved in cell wall biosynthesis